MKIVLSLLFFYKHVIVCLNSRTSSTKKVCHQKKKFSQIILLTRILTFLSWISKNTFPPPTLTYLSLQRNSKKYFFTTFRKILVLIISFDISNDHGVSELEDVPSVDVNARDIEIIEKANSFDMMDDVWNFLHFPHCWCGENVKLIEKFIPLDIMTDDGLLELQYVVLTDVFWESIKFVGRTFSCDMSDDDEIRIWFRFYFTRFL